MKQQVWNNKKAKNKPKAPHKKSPVQGGVSPAEGRGRAAPAGAK